MSRVFVVVMVVCSLHRIILNSQSNLIMAVLLLMLIIGLRIGMETDPR